MNEKTNELIDKKCISSYDKIFSICIILLPFLYQYKGIGNVISLGELLLIPLILISILKNNKKSFIMNSEIVLYFIFVLLTIISMFYPHFVIKDSLTILTRMFFYAIIINIGKKHFKLTYVSKFYRMFVFLLALYLIIQQIFHVLTGGFLPIYFSYKFLFPPEKRAEVLSLYYKFLLYRPSSMFLEPGYYALFCIPYICIFPFLKKQTFGEKFSNLIVYISIFLSGSSAGIIALCVVFYSSINAYLKNVGLKKFINYFFTFIISFIFLFIFCFFFRENNYIDRTISGASFNYRIVRGVEIYEKMNISSKIIGIGPNNLENYMKYNNLMTNYDEERLDYCSSFTQILNYFGLIGFIFFVIYLINIYNDIKINKIAKLLFVLLLFTLSYEAVFFTYRYAYLILFIYGIKGEKIMNSRKELNYEKNKDNCR